MDSPSKQSPSDVMQIIKSMTARVFSGYILKLKENIFGLINFGRKAILLKRQGMLLNKILENMFKTSY
jgi:hypothetical protein